MWRVVCLLPLSFALLVGCRDECDPDTEYPRCEGSILHFCEGPGPDQITPIRRQQRDCAEVGQHCVHPSSTVAFCAADTEPSPLCIDETLAYTCETNTSYVACSRGYVTYRTPCITCELNEQGPSCHGGAATRCVTDAQCA